MYRSDEIITNVIHGFSGTKAKLFTSDTSVDHLRVYNAWGDAREFEKDTTKTKCYGMAVTKFDWNFTFLCDDTWIFYAQISEDQYDQDISKNMQIQNVRKCVSVGASKALKLIFVGCLGTSTQPQDQTESLFIHAIDTQADGTSLPIVDTFEFKQTAQNLIGDDLKVSVLDTTDGGAAILAVANDLSTIKGWQVLFSGTKFIPATNFQVTKDTFVAATPIDPLTLNSLIGENSKSLYFTIKADFSENAGVSLSVQTCDPPTASAITHDGKYQCQVPVVVFTNHIATIENTVISVREDFRHEGTIDVMIGTLHYVVVGTLVDGKFNYFIPFFTIENTFDTPKYIFWLKDQVHLMGTKGKDWILVQIDTHSRGIQNQVMVHLETKDVSEMIMTKNYYYHDISQLFSFIKGKLYFTHLRTPCLFFRPGTIPDPQFTATFKMKAVNLDDSLELGLERNIEVHRDFQAKLTLNPLNKVITGYTESIFSVPTSPHSLQGNFVTITNESKQGATKISAYTQIPRQVAFTEVITKRAHQDAVFLKGSKDMFTFKTIKSADQTQSLFFFNCFELNNLDFRCMNTPSPGTQVDKSNQDYQNITVISATKYYDYAFLLTKWENGTGGAKIGKVIVVNLKTGKYLVQIPIEYVLAGDFKMLQNNGIVSLYAMATEDGTNYWLYHLDIDINKPDSQAKLQKVEIPNYTEKLCPVKLEFFPDSNDFVASSICENLQNRYFQIRIPNLTKLNRVMVDGLDYARGSKYEDFCLTGNGEIHVVGLKDGGQLQQLFRTTKILYPGSGSFSVMNYPLYEMKSISNILSITCNADRNTAHILAADPQKLLYVYNVRLAGQFFSDPSKRIHSFFKIDGTIENTPSILSFASQSNLAGANIFTLDSTDAGTPGKGYSVIHNTYQIDVDASKVIDVTSEDKLIKATNNAGQNTQTAAFTISLVKPETKCTIKRSSKHIEIDHADDVVQNFSLADYLSFTGPYSGLTYTQKKKNDKNKLMNTASPAINGFENINGASGFVVSDEGNHVLYWSEKNEVYISQAVWSSEEPVKSVLLFSGLTVYNIIKGGFFTASKVLMGYLLTKGADSITKIHFFYPSGATWKSSILTSRLTEHILSLNVVMMNSANNSATLVYATCAASYSMNFMQVALDFSKPLAPGAPIVQLTHQPVTDFTTTFDGTYIWAAAIVGNSRSVKFYSLNKDSQGHLQVVVSSNTIVTESNAALNLVNAKISCGKDEVNGGIECGLATRNMKSYILNSKGTGGKIASPLEISSFFLNPPNYFPTSIQLVGDQALFAGYKNPMVSTQISSAKPTSFYQNEFVVMIYNRPKTGPTKPFVFLGTKELGISDSSAGAAGIKLLASRRPSGRVLPTIPLASLYFLSAEHPSPQINEFPILDNPYFVVTEPKDVSLQDKITVQDIIGVETEFKFEGWVDLNKQGGNVGLVVSLAVVGLLILGGLIYFIYIRKSEELEDDDDFFGDDDKAKKRAKENGIMEIESKLLSGGMDSDHVA